MIHLTLQERKVLLFLSALFALGISLSFLKKATGCNYCLLDIYSSKAKPQRFDINQATREQLISLPGIGEKTADLIIDYRGSQGPIKDLAELTDIKGITQTKLERLKEYLK